MKKENGYSFGDSELALYRLDRLARVYEASTRVFLVEIMRHLRMPPGKVLDLGCGPGETTALLAGILEPLAIVGVDASPSFLEEARRRHPRAQFIRAEIGKDEMTEGEAELAYARHFFAHLPDPTAVLHSSAKMVNPGGLLAIEEVAYLRSEVAVFADYYEFVREMLAAREQDMALGLRLGQLASSSGRLEVLRFGVEELVLDARAMAELHLLNVDAFRRTEFGRQRAPQLAAFERAFSVVIAQREETAPVFCGLGQLLARRSLDSSA